MGKDIALALVGVPRASSFLSTFQAHPSTRIAALCDVNQASLAEAGQRAGIGQLYTDYEQMLSEVSLDAVIVATPMQFHVSQAIVALQRGIHVLCEVPAAVSLDEARRLVEVCKQGQAVFMMAENYTYIRSNLLVRELVRRGFFGEIFERPLFVFGHRLSRPQKAHEALDLGHVRIKRAVDHRHERGEA